MASSLSFMRSISFLRFCKPFLDVQRFRDSHDTHATFTLGLIKKVGSRLRELVQYGQKQQCHGITKPRTSLFFYLPCRTWLTCYFSCCVGLCWPPSSPPSSGQSRTAPRRRRPSICESTKLRKSRNSGKIIWLNVMFEIWVTFFRVNRSQEVSNWSLPSK